MSCAVIGRPARRGTATPGRRSAGGSPSRPSAPCSTAVFEFLGTNLGFLQTSQLAMGFWDGRPLAMKRQHIMRIIDVLNDVHKLGIEVSDEEVAHLHSNLEHPREGAAVE